MGRVAESGVSIAARVKQSPKVPPGWVEGLRRKARKVFGLKKVTDMNPKKSLALKYKEPHFFLQKTGPIWYSLASAASFLIYPSV